MLGIPRGRTDLYAASLDCQWIDITDIKPGCWYTYTVCTNIGRSIFEMSFDNNCLSMPLYIPTVGATEVLTYADALARDSAKSFQPGCKH